MVADAIRPSVSFLRLGRSVRTLALILCLPCFLFAQSDRVRMMSVSNPESVGRTMPPSFEENRGKWLDSVLYMSAASEYRVSLTRDGLRLSSSGPAAAAEEIELRWTY